MLEDEAGRLREERRQVEDATRRCEAGLPPDRGDNWHVDCWPVLDVEHTPGRFALVCFADRGGQMESDYNLSLVRDRAKFLLGVSLGESEPFTVPLGEVKVDMAVHTMDMRQTPRAAVVAAVNHANCMVGKRKCPDVFAYLVTASGETVTPLFTIRTIDPVDADGGEG